MEKMMISVPFLIKVTMLRRGGGGKGAGNNSPSPASTNKMAVHPSPAKAKAKLTPNKAVESDGVNDDSASFSDDGGGLQSPMNAPFLGGNFLFCE